MPLVVVAQPVVALMDAGHPLAEGGPLRLSDCLSYPLVLPRPALATRALIDRVLEKRSVPFSSSCASNRYGEGPRRGPRSSTR